MNQEYRFPFEKLRVWQDARQWVTSVYQVTAAFPPGEAFNLTSQIRRAGVSVAANLAEGSSRTSAKDQAHFSQIAYGSLMEAACLTIIASDQSLIASGQLAVQRQAIAGLSNQINAQRNSQLTRSVR
jgi:four helix bundle protein